MFSLFYCWLFKQCKLLIRSITGNLFKLITINAHLLFLSCWGKRLMTYAAMDTCVYPDIQVKIKLFHLCCFVVRNQYEWSILIELVVTVVSVVAFKPPEVINLD